MPKRSKDPMIKTTLNYEEGTKILRNLGRTVAAATRGRGGRSTSHSDNINDSENEEKLQHNTSSVRGSSNIAKQSGNQRYDRSKFNVFIVRNLGFLLTSVGINKQILVSCLHT